MSEWKEVTGANVVKFDTKGQVVEGKFVAVDEGIFGDLFVIDTKDGKVSLPSNTALTTKMKALEIGQKVRVTFLGEKASEKVPGRKYKDFKVETQ